MNSPIAKRLSRSWRLLFLSLSVGCFCSFGILPVHGVSPSVSALSPPGGQIGTDVEVTFTGARLDDVQQVLLYGTGLQALSVESKKTNQAKAILRIASNCPLGEHTMRLRTSSGLSELRSFFVGPFVTMKETEPNNELLKAQLVPLNTTVTGTIASEDVDYFKIPGKKGQRLSIEVEAIRLGRVLFDPYLALMDADGKVIAESDDSMLHLQDSLISIVAPKDGFYYVLLREATWGGGNDFVYRLHLGDFPRPTAVFPPGGPAGKEIPVTFVGDPLGPISQTVKIPENEEDEMRLVPESNGVRAPSGLRFRVNPLPNVLESGVNHDRAHAVMAPSEGPVAFNGIVSVPGEEDWYGFLAQKKQAYEITVFARRLRSPLDSVIQLSDSSGKVIDTNDDSAGPDSYLKFTAEETAVYYLRITDHLKAGGSNFVYRAEVQPPAPKVVLNIPEVARNDTQTRQFIAVPRGNRMAALIHVKRTAFNGDLQFSLPGLPEGVTLEADKMPNGVDTMPWILTAKPDAPLKGEWIQPVARPFASDKQIESQYVHNVEWVRGNNDQVFYASQTHQLAVAVVQEVPFQIQLDSPSIPLVRAGSMKLRVRVERRAGFEDPINLKMLWNPPGVSSETEMTIPKGASSADYTINAKGDAALSTWKVALLGSAPFKSGTAFASSDFANLRVSEAFITGKIATTATEPGQPVEIHCSLEQKEPFEGKASIRLVGLPDKASTPEQQITKEDKEVVFKVTVDPKIPTGSHKNLACLVVMKKGEDTVTQTVGSGGILRIVPPKKKPAESKKVASANASP